MLDSSPRIKGVLKQRQEFSTIRQAVGLRRWNRFAGTMGSLGDRVTLHAATSPPILAGASARTAGLLCRASARESMIGVEFEIRGCGKRCAGTGRELRPGELVYSMLTEEGSALVRSDYCVEAWHGPPPNAIGWWRFTLPKKAPSPTNRLAPHDVLLDLLEKWEGDADRAPLRYVLSLLLLRRRVLREAAYSGAPSDAGIMRLYCPRRGRDYHVLVVTLTSQEMDDVQRCLEELLYAGVDGQEGATSSAAP